MIEDVDADFWCLQEGVFVELDCIGEGRRATVQTPIGPVEVFSVHLSVSRASHAAQIAALLERLPAGRPVIIAGDFNAARVHTFAWEFENYGLSALQRLERAGLVILDEVPRLFGPMWDDTPWPVYHRSGRFNWTYPGNWPWPFPPGADRTHPAGRIDYIAMSPELQRYVVDFGVHGGDAANQASDHRVVWADFDWSVPEPAAVLLWLAIPPAVCILMRSHRQTVKGS